MRASIGLLFEALWASPRSESAELKRGPACGGGIRESDAARLLFEKLRARSRRWDRNGPDRDSQDSAGPDRILIALLIVLSAARSTPRLMLDSGALCDPRSALALALELLNSRTLVLSVPRFPPLDQPTINLTTFAYSLEPCEVAGRRRQDRLLHISPLAFPEAPGLLKSPASAPASLLASGGLLTGALPLSTADERCSVLCRSLSAARFGVARKNE